MVERQKTLGGTCLNWGCIPTKALLEHAHALKIAQAAKEWGLLLGDQPARIDMNQVQARKDKIVTVLTRGIEFLFKKNNITWIKGSARLAGPGTVEVTGEQPQTLDRARDRHRDRVVRAQRAGHRAGPEADHHERRGHRHARDAEVDRHHGQRPDRRRVRDACSSASAAT